MGMADTVTKEYIRSNEVFADAFNYLIYDGEQVVKPALLQELDTTEIAIPFALGENENQTEDVVQKYRDVLKSAVIMQDSRASYILLGVENQTEIHYAMPVRNIIYDALQYGKQVSEVAKRHKSKGDRKGHNKGEYLSGFYKEDRIRPVITLVVHFGADEWDGPLSLYEMMDLEDKKLLEFVQDYRIFLIDPYKLTNEDLEKFSSSLGDVLGYIKYSKDKKALSKFLNDNQVMIMDNDAARVIRDVTNTPIYVPEGKGEIDMCKAVRDMIDESKQEGIAAGKAEGRAEGMAAGELNKAKKMALKMYQKGDSIEEIAEMAEFSVDQVKEWINSAV